MKQTLGILFILIAICTLGCTSCKKDAAPSIDNPYGLPNATQTGANMFACRINGQNQIAKNSIYAINAGYKNDTVSVFGSIGSPNYFDNIGFTVFGNIAVNRTYSFSDQNHAYCLFGTDSTCNGVGQIVTMYSKIGDITLTKIDSANKIISGVFDFRVPIVNCDTLKITDGRFDIKY